MLPKFVKPKGFWWNFLPLPKNFAHTLYPDIWLPKFVYENLLSNMPSVRYQALLLHEQEHLKLQQNGGIIWFIKYLLNRNFRFQEELAAYKVQKKYLENNGENWM